MSIVELIELNGFAIIENALGSCRVAELLAEIEQGLARGTRENIKNSRGETYAARNLAEYAPGLLELWKDASLTDTMTKILGAEFGLVRILYFDKHPNRTWTLPWHKDMTIAVKYNSLPTNAFAKPTRKSGVDHVEAPTELLEQMLTLRIHLDDVTEDNGPLEVATGSHINGKQSVEGNDVSKILVNAGDVLAMRPLLSHASGSSKPGTTQHRRILHLEFASSRELADGFEWHMFQTF